MSHTNLLVFNIYNQHQFNLLQYDIQDCETIITMLVAMEEGEGDDEFRLDLAHSKMRKEFYLKDRYNIPFHSNLDLIWLYESLCLTYDYYEDDFDN